MFISRKLMVIAVMVGSIHAAVADEASDAVQVGLTLTVRYCVLSFNSHKL